MKTSYEKLFNKIIDIIYGQYNEKDSSEESLKKNIKLFRERIVQWKINPKSRKILGRLQPIEILSRMTKVPVLEIEKITNEFGIKLPEVIDLKEFNIDKISESEVNKILLKLENSDAKKVEEEILDVLTEIEKNKFDIDEFKTDAFDFLDLSEKDASVENLDVDSLSSTYHMIKYLEEMIQKIKKGEVYTISLISLSVNGKAAVYMPPEMQDEMDKYNPIIESLKIHSQYKLCN